MLLFSCRVVRQAKWIGPGVRKCVALLADTLYLTVAFQLVRVLTCMQVIDDGDDDDDENGAYY
jgi:hypothetical protein